MKCYYHHDMDAVGLCKACSKAVCPQCCTDVGNGLACTYSCVEEVKSINALIRSNTSASAVNRRAAYLWPLFFVVLGGLFACASVVSGRPIQWFPVLAGCAFAVFGVVLWSYQRAWRKSLQR